MARRYDSSLLGVVTTSANGLHCPIVNRIGLRAGGLYRRIGVTAGYTSLFASPATLKAARAFLPDFVGAPCGEFSVSIRPLRVLRDALQRCGIASDVVLRSGVRKGVYFGAVSGEHVAALRQGRTARTRACLSVEAATLYWREVVLSKALRNRTRGEQFAAHRRQSPFGLASDLAA
jgi:hypothetical protein